MRDTSYKETVCLIRDWHAFRFLKNEILFAVLYWRESSTVTAEKENGLKVCANQMLREMFGCIGVEAAHSWKILHDWEFRNLCR